MATLVALIAILAWQSSRATGQAAAPRPLQAVYVGFDEQGLEQLYRRPITFDEQGAVVAGDVLQLTDTPNAFWDYAVRPVGDLIVYSALDDQGGSDLRQIDAESGEQDLLLACEPNVCNSPSWSADGQFLSFSVRNSSLDGATLLNPPRPWILNVTTGETAPMLSDDQQLGFETRWSADGKWVTYLLAGQGQIGLLNLEDASIQVIERGDGEPVAWHPDKPLFAHSRMEQVQDAHVLHLLLSSPTDDSAINLSGADALVEDRSPAWSPDGEWMAFRRKELEGPNVTLGSQLWLMQLPQGASTGGEIRALTADAGFDHGPPQWSPDGRFLLYQKFPLKGPNIEISVWLLDVENGESYEIARPGRRPGWISSESGTD
ncbi:MAG: hypothetical protein HC802_09520 [Caldilineaceae bacterium]|nr:hypothetical protein [Caldilineaceae bacterium]